MRRAIRRAPSGHAESSSRSGDLGDLGALALRAVGADRPLPGGFGHGGDRLAHVLGEVEADREADPRLAAPPGQLVRGAGAVGAHQQLARQRLLVELLERELQHGGVVGGGVRARVTRPQQPRRRLARPVQLAQQRVVAEAALEVASRLFLVGVGTGQGGVDVQHRVAGTRPQPPRATAGDRDCPAKPLKGVGVDRVDPSKRRRV